MPDAAHIDPSHFLVTVTLSPSELGLYAAVSKAKKITNDQVVSAMVAFCLQLLVSEVSMLSASRRLDDDLERTVLNLAAHLRRLTTLLAGAEKILLDAATLREQLAHLSRKTTA